MILLDVGLPGKDGFALCKEISFSDYAALRKMLGYPKVDMESDEYLIHSAEYLDKEMDQYRKPLVVGGQKLIQGGVRTEPFSQSYLGINGYQFILVVPDAAAGALKPININYTAMTKEPVSNETFAALKVMRDKRNISGDTVYTLKASRDENAVLSAACVFPLFYLAMILTMVSAAILTIQLLSDTARYQKQYELLSKLGMARRDMSRALRRKFMLFYAMPTVPPVIICVVFMRWMGTIFDAGTIVSQVYLWGMIGP